MAEANSLSSVAEHAEALVEQTKDELLQHYKKKLAHYQLRDTIHNCINNHLTNKVELMRIENTQLKELNTKLRELTVISESALRVDSVDTRVKVLRDLVKGWGESVEAQEATNKTNDALRRRAEIEALRYRQKLEEI